MSTNGSDDVLYSVARYVSLAYVCGGFDVTLLQKLEDINDAIERQNVDDLVAHYANDARFVTPTGTAEGREAIRAYWATVFPSVRDVVCRTTWGIESGDTVAAEVHFEATYVADGKRIVLPTMGMLRFRDELVISDHEYFDMKEIERQIERQLLEQERPDSGPSI